MNHFLIIRRNQAMVAKMTRCKIVRQRRTQLRTGYAALSTLTVLIAQRALLVRDAAGPVAGAGGRTYADVARAAARF
jgi:hypothetical protein